MFASLLLAIRKIIIALMLATQGYTAVWCDVCGELTGSHEYANCPCYEPCECECEECEAMGPHLNIVHADE